MNGGGEGALLAAVRAEVLALRRDVTSVLANFLLSIDQPPKDATELIERDRTKSERTLSPLADMAEAEALRSELLDLRRDVAIVMANLLVAKPKTSEVAKYIVMDTLVPKKPNEPK